jgi:hypothetical protein
MKMFSENYSYLPFVAKRTVSSGTVGPLDSVFLDAVDWIRLLYRTLDAFSKAIIKNNKVLRELYFIYVLIHISRCLVILLQNVLQDMLRLLTFCQKYHELFLIDSLRPFFDEITESHAHMWLAVIPQLIAMLDLEVPVRGQIHELLNGISGLLHYFSLFR